MPVRKPATGEAHDEPDVPTVGVLVAQDTSLALAQELPGALRGHSPGIAWRAEVSEVRSAESTTRSHELLAIVRRHLPEAWLLAGPYWPGLFPLARQGRGPGGQTRGLSLHAGHRPVMAYASATRSGSCHAVLAALAEARAEPAGFRRAAASATPSGTSWRRLVHENLAGRRHEASARRRRRRSRRRSLSFCNPARDTLRAAARARAAIGEFFGVRAENSPPCERRTTGVSNLTRLPRTIRHAPPKRHLGPEGRASRGGEAAKPVER